MSFAKRVHLPIVPVSMLDLCGSKQRVNKLITRYNRKIKQTNDLKLKHSKQVRVDVLKEILNTYRIIDETI